MPAIIAYGGEIGKIRFCPAATKTRYAEDMTSNGVGWGKEPYTAWGYSDWLNNISIRQGYENCHYGSYAVNGWIEDRPDHLTDDEPATKPWFWRRSNKISRADTVPFLVDGQWIDVWPRPNFSPPATENEHWQSSSSQMGRIVQNRHNGRENVVFMDGSSRLVGIKELWTFKWHRKYDTRGMYTKAGGASRSSWPKWMEGFDEF
jgi:prepilin-type processing-associated H-X9-DG protein